MPQCVATKSLNDRDCVESACLFYQCSYGMDVLVILSASVTLDCTKCFCGCLDLLIVQVDLQLWS